MCGIVGYIGKRQATPLLIDGLKKLEYRGYDSAGICVAQNSNFYLQKKKGKVAELENQINLDIIENRLNLSINGNVGIAHTRWATHGEPNEINAHPHLDCTKNIAVAHNGIIENYSALKELLEKEGHKIVSQTDTEIIAHLIEKFFVDDNFEQAVVSALKLLEGAYGLAILNKNSQEIIVAKKGSPLVLGIGQNEMFAASDVCAILAQTKRIVYLEDNEIAILKDNGYSVKNLNGQIIDKKIEEIKWSISEIEKKGFKHFMLKEIFEQPQAIENTIRGRMVNGKTKLILNLEINKINRIIITACGTSWHSALLGKYFIEKYAKIPVDVDYASEFRYRDPIVKNNDLVITISQSGETADTLAALREAKNKKAKIFGIVNVVDSSIAREVDSGIYLHAGPEIGVASTKAFTCQVTSLLLLALHFAELKNIKFDTRILPEIQKLPETVKETLKIGEEIKQLAEKFKDHKNFLYLGRNLNFPVALEGALKLKEISYIHAEGYPAAEMKHGPIALIDENMPVVFICPKDSVYEKILSNMEEIKARGGNIIAIINEDDEKILRLANHIIKVPKTSDDLMPIINTIPLQLLAYYVADLKGLNVDKPRNLAKSVTVE